MSSFYQKSGAAHQKIESGHFSLRMNRLGEMVPEKPYHVMYSSGFAGYFTYMVLCDFGSLDENRQRTPWGFDYYDDLEDYSPYYRKAPADYEHFLSPTEVVSWLRIYYDNLPDAEDYQYLITILETAYNSSDVRFAQASYNKALALGWLQSKLQQASVSSIPLTDFGFQWNASNAEFMELIYALTESGVITSTMPGGKKGIAERLGKLLGVEGLKNISVTVNALRKKRNNDRLTPLLDKLKNSYLAWVHSEK